MMTMVGWPPRTDARGIVEIRFIDALDRVTSIDYPDDSLDITYTYGDLEVPFSLGRRTSIERGGQAVNTTYDRFGRVLEDGALIYSYDRNGNRTRMEYPGGVVLHSSYDFADRPATLTMTRPGEADEMLATASGYEPSGPLASLTLGNALVETRGFDIRDYPSSLVVDGLGTPILDWQCSTDAVGKITNILDGIDAANSDSEARPWQATTGESKSHSKRRAGSEERQSAQLSMAGPRLRSPGPKPALRALNPNPRENSSPLSMVSFCSCFILRSWLPSG